MRLAVNGRQFQFAHMKTFKISNAKQTTLANSVEAKGYRFAPAVPVQVRLLPAPPDTGYVFLRTDLGGFEIPANVESVAHCSYATTLMRTGVMLSTVEHLLSACVVAASIMPTSKSTTSKYPSWTGRRKPLRK